MWGFLGIEGLVRELNLRYKRASTGKGLGGRRYPLPAELEGSDLFSTDSHTPSKNPGGKIFNLSQYTGKKAEV